MNSNCDNFIDIPCFKCLFWNPIKESHLYCNPDECPKLTEWLLKQVANDEQAKSLTLTVSKNV